MKLATYRDGSRDGQLLVVSRDLSLAHYATGIAHRLQQVLDDWNFVSPALQDLYETLNQGKARHAFEWDPRQCLAPLPRAYHCAAAPALESGVAPVPVPAAAPAPAAATLTTRPGDPLAGAWRRWPADGLWTALEAGLAAVVSDVPQGLAADRAIDSVRLLMLQAGLVPQAVSWEGGCAVPGAQFSPLAVTPDELGTAWRGGRADLNLVCSLNGRRFAAWNVGDAMPIPLGDLIAQWCARTALGAGALLCAAPVRHGLPLSPPGRSGAPAGLRAGDVLTADLQGPDGHSLFGPIGCELVPTD
ncbi:MAG: fumarylacetoacetate hydrolase family protein [Rhodoferax sp.]|nr:fumarylacetoacetate hydrolase family protein [Rhodoferax sp.]